MKRPIALLLLLALLLTACVPAAEIVPEEPAPTGGYKETIIIEESWYSSNLAAFPGGAGFAAVGDAENSEGLYDLAYIWYPLQDGAVSSRQEILVGDRSTKHTITTENGVIEPYFGETTIRGNLLPWDGCLIGRFFFRTGSDYMMDGLGINLFDFASTSVDEPTEQWLFCDTANSLYGERVDFTFGMPAFGLDGKMLMTCLRSENTNAPILLNKPDLMMIDIETGIQTPYPDIGISLAADNCQLFEDTIFVHSGDTVTAYDALTGAENSNFPKTQIGDGSSEYGIYSDKPVKFCGADSEAVYYLDSQGLNRKVHGGSVSEVLLDASRCLLSSDKWLVADVAMVDAHEFYVEYDMSADYWGSSSPDDIVVSYIWDDSINIDASSAITAASLDFGALIEVAREELRSIYPDIGIKIADLGHKEYTHPIEGDYKRSELYQRNVVDSP